MEPSGETANFVILDEDMDRSKAGRQCARSAPSAGEYFCIVLPWARACSR
jgi:hypothetical protein